MKYGIVATMSDAYAFYPRQRNGFIFHCAALLGVGAAAGVGLLQATRADIGPTFLVALLPILFAVVLIPTLVYRLTALRSAVYRLERDGIQLRWGLRQEDIPMNRVLWVRPARAFKARLPLPLIFWPGAVLGRRRLGGSGEIEYLADTTRGLLLVATPGRVFAISPEDPAAFLAAYTRLSELGVLSPLAERSVYPSFIIDRVWKTPAARILTLSGVLLSLALVVVVSLAVPGRDTVALGFQPDGSLRELVPSVRLLLLPVLNSTFFVVDLFIGLYFFRLEGRRSLAYLAWGSGVATPVLFLVGALLILSAS